jgi:hypothetical protein
MARMVCRCDGKLLLGFDAVEDEKVLVIACSKGIRSPLIGLMEAQEKRVSI